jgi:outer membrane receptor for ferrienterochelin and colicin
MLTARHAIHCLLILCLGTPIARAQPDLARKVSLNVIGGRLEYVLQEIGKTAEVELSYSSKKIDLAQRVSIQKQDAPLAEILEELAWQANLDYMIVEDHIVIKPARRKQEIQPRGPFHYTLSGYIRDSQSEEALIGATVYVAELEKGTISNEFGFYSLTLPSGSYSIRFSYIGYKTIRWQTNLLADQVIDMKLGLEPAKLEEVEIVKMDDEVDLAQIRTGNMNLAPRAVEQMPAFLGEQDVIKSLDAIPGISLQGDGSTLFFVRGGNKDQNLILIDDAPIYNPAHFLGIFSTFIPDAIKDINIYKGDIPAMYGGRLSSLIDVRSKDGDMNNTIVNGSLGLATAKLAVEGPFTKGKSSYFLSGRTSYIKWYVQQYIPRMEKFYFTDLNVKFNFRLSPKDRLYLSAYAGRDHFILGTSTSDGSGISWQNLAGTIRWNHLFSDRLFSNTTLYSSKYDYNFIINVTDNDFWDSHIANLSLKTDFTWFANPDITLRFGAKVSRHHFNPGNMVINSEPDWDNPREVHPRTAREWALYVSNNHAITRRLSLRYGLRLGIWQNMGEATEYVYDKLFRPVDTLTYPAGQAYHTYARMEPRFGMTYQAWRNTALKASYCRTAQYIQLVTNSISPFTTLEVYLPAAPNIQPQTADQYSVGFFQKFHKAKLDLSIEAFTKKMQNQIDYKDHAYMLLNPHIEQELRFGTGEAYGFEVLLKKYQGRLSGWIGYSWSRSWRQIEDINNNERYRAAWDRPHDLSIYLTYDFSERWTASLNWIYMTGFAFSSPTSFYQYNGYTVPIYENKNNDRLPDYHRLDVSAEFRINKKPRRYSHKLRLTLFNLYNRTNPIAINFNKTLNPKGDPVVPGTVYPVPELFATQMYIYGLVPAINYIFTFK